MHQMTVYVDSARWKKPKGRKFYAHMMADSLEELHAFAHQIGVKRHFFHNAAHTHYDINEEQRIVAIEAGAVPVTSKQLVLISRQLSQEPIPDRGHI